MCFLCQLPLECEVVGSLTPIYREPAVPMIHVFGSNMSLETCCVSKCLAVMSSIVVIGVPVLVN